MDMLTTSTPVLPSPCPCGGDRLLYHEPGLPALLVCIDCSRWEPAEPHPVTEG